MEADDRNAFVELLAKIEREREEKRKRLDEPFPEVQAGPSAVEVKRVFCCLGATLMHIRTRETLYSTRPRWEVAFFA